MANKTLKILGLNYSITTIDDHYPGDTAQGFCDSKNTKLSVNSNQPLENMEFTLLHETVHAISEMLALNLTEEQVAGVSTGLFDVFNNNNYRVDFFKKV